MKHNQELQRKSTEVNKLFTDWYNFYKFSYLSIFEDIMATGKKAVIMGLSAKMPDDVFNAIRQSVMKYKWDRGELLFVAANCVPDYSSLFPKSGYITFAYADRDQIDMVNIKVHKHIVYTVDCFVYDFILGINGVPLNDYIKLLYQFNDSLMIVPSLTQFACLNNSNYAPTGKQFIKLTRGYCTCDEFLQEVTDESYERDESD